MRIVTVPGLLARIKSTVREVLASDEYREQAAWGDEFDAKIYRDYRTFVHRHWPSLRSGAVEAEYAQYLNDLVADQGSTFATCILHRRRNHSKGAASCV